MILVDYLDPPSLLLERRPAIQISACSPLGLLFVL